MTEQVHSKTIRLLGKNASRCLSEFGENDPSYFAPFLKKESSRLQIHPALAELATLEWTYSFVQFQSDSWVRGALEGQLRLNPSLVLLRLQFDALALFEERTKLSELENNPNVLAVYTLPNQSKPITARILPEWAPVLDFLSEGPYLEDRLNKDLSIRFKIHFEPNHLDSIVNALRVAGIIEREK